MAGVDRLVVLNRVSIIQPLPLAYRDRIARIPGVTEVTFANWFGGVYQDERNFFPQFAIDRETYREMYPEFIVPDDQWQAFLTDKEGAVVGEALAERFEWKVGDRIPLKGTIFPGAWEFNIRGIYRGQPASGRHHAVLVPLGLPRRAQVVHEGRGGLVRQSASPTPTTPCAWSR